MSEENQKQTTLLEEGGKNEQEGDVKHLIFKYLRYWWLFALCIITALAIAFLINRYTVRTYKTTANLRILKNQENQSMGLSEGEGGISLKGNINLSNEVETIKSRKLLAPVVDALNLNTVYYSEGKFRSEELWKNDIPFKIKWKNEDKSTPNFSIKPINLKGFEIHLPDETETFTFKEEKERETFNFNEQISFEGYEFTVELNPDYKSSLSSIKGKTFMVKNKSKRSAVNKLRSQLSVQRPKSDGSDILDVSIKGSNKTKNEAIVDSVLSIYRQDDVSDQQKISRQTQKFIAERVNTLYQELDTVESGLVSFKQSNDFYSIESEAGLATSRKSESENRRVELETQRELAKIFRDQLQNGQGYTLLPANIGIDNSSINSLTQRYNSGVLERSDRLVSSTLENPVIITLEARLDNLKSNILSSVSAYLSDLELKINRLRDREYKSTGRRQRATEEQRGLRNIMRQQETKEKLYLYLLEKREEAGLKYAVASPTSKVVDYAYTSGTAITPQTQQNYLTALLIAATLPFIFLYFKFFFDSKIRSSRDIRNHLPSTPLMAEIPQITNKAKQLIGKNDRRNVAEVFRILRTNLSYIRTDEHEGGAVIYVTSTIKGEGKTFTSVNTAHSYAATGKKTLIIGADLRNPKIHKYYGVNKNLKGLSAYLSDNSVQFEELVHNANEYFENLDYILGGEIPPNPSELLMDKRFKELLDKARKRYDYILVDTAPTLLVTDTFLISQYADATIYMVKVDYTEINLLNYIKDAINDGKLKKTCIVLNGISPKARRYDYGYGYNYGYGYGYGEDEGDSPWWKFWK